MFYRLLVPFGGNTLLMFRFLNSGVFESKKSTNYLVSFCCSRDIVDPVVPFALRLSSTLMFGVVLIYREQTRTVWCKENLMIFIYCFSFWLKVRGTQRQVSSKCYLKTSIRGLFAAKLVIWFSCKFLGFVVRSNPQSVPLAVIVPEIIQAYKVYWFWQQKN